MRVGYDNIVAKLDKRDDAASIVHACPRCKVDLLFDDHGTRRSRLIAVEEPDLFEGVLYWRCPDCDEMFPRFQSNGSTLHTSAIVRINLWKESDGIT